jgi:hypothetical protein
MAKKRSSAHSRSSSERRPTVTYSDAIGEYFDDPASAFDDIEFRRTAWDGARPLKRDTGYVRVTVDPRQIKPVHGLMAEYAQRLGLTGHISIENVAEAYEAELTKAFDAVIGAISWATILRLLDQLPAASEKSVRELREELRQVFSMYRDAKHGKRGRPAEDFSEADCVSLFQRKEHLKTEEQSRRTSRDMGLSGIAQAAEDLLLGELESEGRAISIHTLRARITKGRKLLGHKLSRK